jgi:hypothetical protein
MSGQLTSTMTVPTSAAAFSAALEGLTRLNELLIKQHDVPPIYEAGVRYRREKRDKWKHALDVQADGVGDCEDLSAWRAAEMRVSGEDPGARVEVYRSGPRKFHAIVERSDGTTEDPSRVLGMGQEGIGAMNEGKKARRKYARELAQYCKGIRKVPLTPSGGTPWIGVGADPEPDNQSVTFDLYKSGQGWSGIVRLPTADGRGRAVFAKTSPSPTKGQAASKAVSIAKNLAKIPGVKELLPPQASMALNVLSTAAPAAKAAVSVLKKLF